MGALTAAFTAAFLGPNGNGTNGDGTPYRPKPSDAAALGAAADNAIPNAQDLSALNANLQALNVDLNTKITEETAQREQVDQSLLANVTQEVSDRTAAVAAETAARQQDVKSLLANIQTLNTALNTAVSEEAANRQAEVDSLLANITDVNTQVNTAISAETALRKQDTASLLGNIQTEIQDRSAAVAAEAAGRAADVVTLNDSIATEVAGRTAAVAAARGYTDDQVAEEAAARAAAVADVRFSASLAGRPGDDPGSFTSDLNAGHSGPAVAGQIVVGTAGRALRVAGAAVVASLAMSPIETDRDFKVRAVLRRQADPADPAGDAVVLAVAWYGADGTWLGISSPIAELALPVAAGRVWPSAIVSATSSDPRAIQPPGGAAYFRAFVQTYGDTALTDVEVLAAADVSDADVVSIDVDRIAGNLANLADAQAAAIPVLMSESFLDALLFGC